MAAPPQATATGVSKKAIRRKEAKEPKVVENSKKCMFIKGPKSSEILNELLNDLVGPLRRGVVTTVRNLTAGCSYQ